MMQNQYIHTRYAPGKGANNRAEFTALRTLLEIATKKEVKNYR
jgi:hypothetical protein